MILFVAMSGAVWGIGAVMKAPKGLRWAVISVLFAAVLLSHLILPDGHPLRMATGGSAQSWLLLGGVLALFLLYRLGLGTLRAMAQPADPPEKQGTFTPVELDRYARHIVMREIGGPGQKSLKQAKVLVIGAGGLGSPALLYLAASGVGTIGVIDADQVDNSNLQRQVIHTDAEIGNAKVFSAARAMQAQNPFVTVKPYNCRFTLDIAPELMAEYDIVLDGTDNFDTRYLSNSCAVAAGIPLVSGALTQWEGQISVFDPAQSGPCYRCIFPERPADGLAPSCAEAGVIGPLPGVIGTMMALEAIKLITGAGAPLRGDMLIYDALWGETRKIALKRREDCPDCGHLHASG